MLANLLIASLILLSLAVVGCIYRLIKGPSMADRIAALDTIGVILLSMIAIICMIFQTRAYFDIILVIGIVAFIGTTAFARFIERGDVIERGDDWPSR